MNRTTTWILLLVILLAGFFLRQYRLLDFPYHGDEVDEGDIALEILDGHLAPFYPQNEGNEPLYQFVLAPFFAVLGDSVIANRFPSVAWSTLFIALMYAYGRALFQSRRVGVMCAALTAALWWPTVFGRLGLREISQPVMMIPALLALIHLLRAPSRRHALQAGIIGGIFAGLTTYTFLSGRGFGVIVILFLIYAAIAQRTQLREQWRAWTIYIALMIALSLPLFVYLNIHPEYDFHVGDLSARSWLAQGDLTALAPQVWDTLGMFTFRGDMNWVRNIAGRPVFVGIEGILFYLGIAVCLWRWRKPEYALQLIVLAVMLAPNILAENPPRWTRSIGILPGMIAITVLPVEWLWSRLNNFRPTLGSSPAVLGVRETAARLPSTQIVNFRFASRAPARIFPLLVLLLGISIYARTAYDMFAIWIDHPGVYWLTLAYFSETANYINRAPEATPLDFTLQVDEPWRETNLTRPINRRDVPLRFVQDDALVFPDDPRGLRVAFQMWDHPALPLLDTFIDLDAPIYTGPRIDEFGYHPLKVYRITRATIYEHLVRAQAGALFLPDANQVVTAPVQIGDSLEFLGYEILNPTARTGEKLNVFTFWKIARRPPPIATFLHLTDRDQNIVAQYDGWGANIDYLAPGDIVVQLHALELPENLPASEFRLLLGAYTREDSKRLPLNVGGDHLWLQTWQPAQN